VQAGLGGSSLRLTRALALAPAKRAEAAEAVMKVLRVNMAFHDTLKNRA
jgi:hypothetical protein